jgi:hypothetical protein
LDDVSSTVSVDVARFLTHGHVYVAFKLPSSSVVARRNRATTSLCSRHVCPSRYITPDLRFERSFFFTFHLHSCRFRRSSIPANLTAGPEPIPKSPNPFWIRHSPVSPLRAVMSFKSVYIEIRRRLALAADSKGLTICCAKGSVFPPSLKLHGSWVFGPFCQSIYRAFMHECRGGTRRNGEALFESLVSFLMASLRPRCSRMSSKFEHLTVVSQFHRESAESPSSTSKDWTCLTCSSHLRCPLQTTATRRPELNLTIFHRARIFV